MDGFGDRRHTVPAHAVPADDSTTSRRRRRDDGPRPATATAVPVVRAATSGQTAWNKRGRRLRALLSDDHAGVAELKRELHGLLVAAEAGRVEAAEERQLVAAELQGLLPPLLKEITQLRARASFWDVPRGKDVKGVETDEADVQVEGFADDVLRSAAGKAAPAVKSNRPSAKTRPAAAIAADAAATRATVEAAGRAGGGGGGGSGSGPRAPPRSKGAPGDRLASLASELSKRQKLSAVRAIEAAVTEAQGGAVAPLLALLGGSPFEAASTAAALDRLLLGMHATEAGQLRMRVHAVQGELTLLSLLEDGWGRGGGAGGRAASVASSSRQLVKLTALNALESLAEACAPIAIGLSEAGGALLCALLSEAAVRTSRSHALLPHVLLCLLALARTAEAAAQVLRKAGCVEAAVPLLDQGAESNAARPDVPPGSPQLTRPPAAAVAHPLGRLLRAALWAREARPRRVGAFKREAALWLALRCLPKSRLCHYPPPLRRGGCAGSAAHQGARRAQRAAALH